MLRITQSSNVDAARSYYTRGLSREDYYSQGQEIVGQWGGTGAMRLGLHGAVTKDAFDALCQNRHPVTGERLTPRTKSNRRVGYDFNFHVPKSVSIYYAITGDRRILDSFRAAVRDTMCQIETDAMTQVRCKGQTSTRTTGNLVWGEFVHFTARPVGGSPDPHLHAHCFTFNATWDQNESRFKSSEFGNIKRDGSYYEMAFHSRLTKALADHGYAIRRSAKGWELAGVPARTIKAFSRRTEQIDSIARSRGITDASAKAALGARTRQRKQLALSASELRQEWEGRLSAADHAAIRAAVPPETHADLGLQPTLTAREAVEHAADHCFERASVVPERTLLTHAMRRGLGEVSPEAIHEVFQKSRAIRTAWGNRVMVTTPEVLAEETAMLRFARDGRGAHAPLAAEEVLRTTRLNQGQTNAVRHVWDSHDRVIVVSGGAGTGKTTLMREAIRGIESQGKKVHVLAPTAEASRGVLRREGFEFAETVAKFLQDQSQHERARGQVIWIDEAGLLGTRTLGQVFSVAQEHGCRVILSGDTNQHRAVDRGDALRLLERFSGVKAVEVVEIVRQKGLYKEAVASLARGDVGSALSKLDALGAILEVPTDERYQHLAGEYLNTIRDGKAALVVSPTHAEGNRVTDLIRQGLRHSGHLRGEERETERLQSLGLTEAERRDPAQYRQGLVIQFQGSSAGFRAGERGTVEDVTGGVVCVRRRDGACTNLPLEAAARFDVFEPSTLGVHVGEQIRITRNGKATAGQRLNNGAVYRVRGFTSGGDIRLDNGWEIPRDYGHLAYAYTSTSHTAQSKTVDRVFVAQSADSFVASDREQFYVSVSRAKESVTVYTDDKHGLTAAVTPSGARLSATEVLTPSLEQTTDRASRLWTAAIDAVRKTRQLVLESAEQITRRLDRALGSRKDHPLELGA